MDLQLSGRRALISGASRGIGRAIARQLALEGVDCAIFSRTEEAIREAAQQLAAETGRRIVPLVGDVRDPASIRRVVEEAAAELGGIEILVNCAARVSGGEPEDFARVSEEMILSDFEEKTLGYFRLARAAVPYMQRAGWGRIVNISGTAARVAGNISAGARNVAIVHMTKSLALALGRDGINVNALYPAVTETERLHERMSRRAQAEGVPVEDLLREAGKKNAIGRLVTKEEVAYVAAFLCSPLAAAITGEAISVSGGLGREVHY